ncbi:AbrB/MazE/SpoVT family DNA-binding domain-containing protein [uncultured Thiodictyon sp.]|uniref:AbrB/MazE/SpoVT family DNA-binding domain-containing protein n=1 Tax=uncultured Thiodictyon sp. TaxID=1846217 RepID=UPI0025DCF5B2|nr:AbrB/MazE/SpoVT family DNA-binding domain-containing protein [uncultured Thiodictyon sp.]
MRSTISSRGQTVIPADIRNRFKLGPADRLDWFEENGQIRVVPVQADPIAALRARGKGDATVRLIADHQADRD